MSKQLLSPEKIVTVGIQTIEAGTPLTFANLARTLGTRSQALYPYFNNQTALSYAITDAVLARANAQLQQALFGLSGQPAVMQFALTCRQLGLAHPKLVLFMIGLPRHEDISDEAMQDFRKMLTTLIGELVHTERVQLLGGRWLRDLIIGEVANISGGWFINQDLPQEDSFRWTVTHGLADLIAEDQRASARG